MGRMNSALEIKLKAEKCQNKFEDKLRERIKNKTSIRSEEDSTQATVKPAQTTQIAATSKEKHQRLKSQNRIRRRKLRRRK